jgi:hypothetical protein
MILGALLLGALIGVRLCPGTQKSKGVRAQFLYRAACQIEFALFQSQEIMARARPLLRALLQSPILAQSPGARLRKTLVVSDASSAFSLRPLPWSITDVQRLPSAGPDFCPFRSPSFSVAVRIGSRF